MLANLGLDSRISELSGISGDYSESELQLFSRSLYYLLNIQFRKFCNGIVYSIALRYSLYDRSLFKCGCTQGDWHPDDLNHKLCRITS